MVWYNLYTAKRDAIGIPNSIISDIKLKISAKAHLDAFYTIHSFFLRGKSKENCLKKITNKTKNASHHISKRQQSEIADC